MVNWLKDSLENMSKAQLCGLFSEIQMFRKTGILHRGMLDKFEREFSYNVSHTPARECMRLVEDSILYEMARRYSESEAD